MESSLLLTWWMQGSHTALTLVLSAFVSLTCDVYHISTVLSSLKEPLTASFTGETEASLLSRLGPARPAILQLTVPAVPGFELLTASLLQAAHR